MSRRPNKRLKLAARVDYGMNLFFRAPQLKRDPLGGCAMRQNQQDATAILQIPLRITVVDPPKGR